MKPWFSRVGCLPSAGGAKSAAGIGVLTARYSSEIDSVCALRDVICSGSSVSRASQTVPVPRGRPPHSLGGSAIDPRQAGRPFICVDASFSVPARARPSTTSTGSWSCAQVSEKVSGRAAYLLRTTRPLP